MILFEWDENKNSSNINKHKIDFEEASTVFYDENALMIYDDEHSDSEERFILIGFSLMARMIVVCHCYRQKDNNSDVVIRLISARKATKRETEQYLEGITDER